MSRLEKRFASLKAAGKKALIPYICAGDPSLESTVPLLHELVRSGASAIELGMPFSDPMADGPVIQRASERAISRGSNLDFVFDCVKEFRKRTVTRRSFSWDTRIRWSAEGRKRLSATRPRQGLMGF